MAKKTKRKPPSRERYEAANPTVSCRLDRANHSRLTSNLKASGCSFRDFVIDALGREESLIKKRVATLAAKRLGVSDEEHLRWHDELLWQVLSTLLENRLPALCPQCEKKGEYRLLLAWGDEIGPNGEREKEVPTWKCPNCGWFVDTFKRKDPKSIKWNDPSEVKLALKPGSPPKKKKR